MSGGNVPPITDDLRREAARRPNGYVYAIDPMFDVRGAVPGHGVVGAWKVNAQGRITGDFTANPSYRPSPVALEFREPRSALEGALQLAATGYRPTSEVLTELLTAPLFVFGQEGGGLFVTGTDEDRAVQAFTDEEGVTSTGWQRVERTTGEDVVRALPEGVSLVLNPGTQPTLRFSHQQVHDALAGGGA